MKKLLFIATITTMISAVASEQPSQSVGGVAKTVQGAQAVQLDPDQKRLLGAYYYYSILRSDIGIAEEDCLDDEDAGCPVFDIDDVASAASKAASNAYNLLVVGGGAAVAADEADTDAANAENAVPDKPSRPASDQDFERASRAVYVDRYKTLLYPDGQTMGPVFKDDKGNIGSIGIDVDKDIPWPTPDAIAQPLISYKPKPAGICLIINQNSTIVTNVQPSLLCPA